MLGKIKRPCPFCGRTNDLKVEPVHVRKFPGHSVACGFCGCRGPDGYTEDEAVTLWETKRAPETGEPDV